MLNVQILFDVYVFKLFRCQPVRHPMEDNMDDEKMQSSDIDIGSDDIIPPSETDSCSPQDGNWEPNAHDHDDNMDR